MGVNDRILTPAPIRPLTDREVSAMLGALFGGFLSSGLATPETLTRALHFWGEKGLIALIALIAVTQEKAGAHAEKADG